MLDQCLNSLYLLSHTCNPEHSPNYYDTTSQPEDNVCKSTEAGTAFFRKLLAAALVFARERTGYLCVHFIFRIYRQLSIKDIATKHERLGWWRDLQWYIKKKINKNEFVKTAKLWAAVLESREASCCSNYCHCMALKRPVVSFDILLFSADRLRQLVYLHSFL